MYAAQRKRTYFAAATGSCFRRILIIVRYERFPRNLVTWLSGSVGMRSRRDRASNVGCRPMCPQVEAMRLIVARRAAGARHDYGAVDDARA